MKTVIIQTELSWENPQENCVLLHQKIAAITETVDLIVLPEMFTSGFTMNPKAVAETMEGPSIAWLKQLAHNKDCAITGSLVIEEDGNYFNRLVFVQPDGSINTYDKRHLFTLAGEDKVYTAGSDKLVIDFRGFKICLLICYDLRFPVFARNVEHYDLLVYVANWPKLRVQAWDILLRARAVENMCYVIGVNRVGTDGNQHQYVGHSQVVDYLGNYLLQPQDESAHFMVDFDKGVLLETRRKLAFLDDQDTFKIL